MYSSQRNSSTGDVLTFESAANAEPATLGQIVAEGENAVAKIGLGGLAQASDGAASRKPGTLGGVGVRRVDQAPPLIDLSVVQQPRDGRGAAPGNTVGHFLLLFRDVDMDGFIARYCDCRGQFVRRDGAQRMRSDAIADSGAELGVFIERKDEPSLTFCRHGTAKLRVAIQHREKCEANPGIVGSGFDTMGQLSLIVVARPVRRVVQVVEFGDRGVAVHETFDIELRGDRLHIFRS